MKKVIVIGGGFAGGTAAKILERHFDVTLIDSEDYFEFTPGVLRVLVEPEHFDKIQAKHSNYLKKTKIVIGCVSEVGKDYVKVEGEKDKIKFDYLVISSGSSYNSPIKESGVVYPSRVKHLKESYGALKNAKRVYVVGGGLVGTELMAEICTHYKDKELILIHSHERLMERNNEKVSKYAEMFLKKMGVKIIFKERVKDVKDGDLITESGKVFERGLAFFTVGIKPNYEFMNKNFGEFVDKGIRVNEYLQFDDCKNIFVAGDVTGIKEEKTAQTSEKHGRLAAHNIIALEKGKDMKRYIPKRRPMVISLGKKRGIIENGNYVQYGWLPSRAKALIEKWEMFKRGKV